MREMSRNESILVLRPNTPRPMLLIGGMNLCQDTQYRWVALWMFTAILILTKAYAQVFRVLRLKMPAGIQRIAN